MPMSSRILEGTALSTPSCSTACTNLLCNSGVQSTYIHVTHFKILNLSKTKKQKVKEKNETLDFTHFPKKK